VCVCVCACVRTCVCVCVCVCVFYASACAVTPTSIIISTSLTRLSPTSQILGVIKPHPALAQKGSGVGGISVLRKHKMFRAIELPMLTVPRPWQSVDSSPYLVTPASLMRCREDQYQHVQLLSRMQHSVGEVYDALNFVGSCPWRVNVRVLDHLIPLYQSGEEHPDLAIPGETVDMPSMPSTSALTSMTDDEVREISTQRKESKKLQVEANSVRGALSNQVRACCLSWCVHAMHCSTRTIGGGFIRTPPPPPHTHTSFYLLHVPSSFIPPSFPPHPPTRLSSFRFFIPLTCWAKHSRTPMPRHARLRGNYNHHHHNNR
jgi:hypothetical protein